MARLKYGAIIIENRLGLDQIRDVALKHFEFLSDEWDFRLYKTRVRTLSDYNRLLGSPEFWESIKYEKVLVFQHDSELLRKGIEDFLKYDYVGAPWKFQENGGNGGLSIRSVEVMREITKKFPYHEGLGYEDVYFSNHIEKVGGNLAPREVCSEFSCETIFKLGTLGAHAIDKYFTKEQCEQIRNQYKNG